MKDVQICLLQKKTAILNRFLVVENMHFWKF